VKGQYIGAIDQGTTSTRFIIFDKQANVVAKHQIEHRQIFPQPGWVEHDALEIWQRTQEVIKDTLQKSGIDAADIAGIGITNQRETTVVWDRHTGQPFGNAIVWQCLRTQGICESLETDGGLDRFRDKVGLPLSPYFSGPKIKWVLDNMPGARKAAEKGDALFGNMDSWLIWWLTGGPGKGVHTTDVTNASRTMLMNIKTLAWDREILDTLGIPEQVLPEIRPSSDTRAYGYTTNDGPFGTAIPVCGDLGDQQAALFGQACFEPGEAKNTYGTGCFLLLNTGTTPVPSTSGLLTTVGYRLAGKPPVYCLEAPIAVAGSLVQWLRDNLRLFDKSSEVEALARTVSDNGGVYLVPAFSGWLAPYWDADARGLLIGLTGYSNRGHLARAALESTAYQTNDLLRVMEKDSGVKLTQLRVDGGMVVNDLLMQFQADILDIPVVRPRFIETTSLGAAYAAGLAVGVWHGLEQVREMTSLDKVWQPVMDPETRHKLCTGWDKAVARSLKWT
jgi:glycerol kinase